MVPSAFIINREGLMEGIIVGQREWCGPTSEAALKERRIVDKYHHFRIIFLVSHLSQEFFVKYLYKSESYSIPQRLHFIPLKETVIFPYVIAPLFFQTDEALTLLNKAILENSLIGCVGQRDPHLKNIPAGATPKDGPSAGITIATAVLSLLKGKPVPHEIAMTGELTLSGRVLPAGGIKEKILAGRRAGVKAVILPKKNEENLDDIPDYVKREMNLVLVEHIQEVLDLTLPS